MKKVGRKFALVAAFATMLAVATAASAGPPPAAQRNVPGGGAVKAQGGGFAAPSGSVEEGAEFNLGTGITECPQAGNLNPAKELRHRQIDQVEALSSQGDDRRTNVDYSCFPQNEVSVDINPRNLNNFVVGANDYRLGTGSSGFHWTTDGGKTFYDGIIPFPSGPASQTRGEGFVPSGGDPVIVYDRDGIAYYAQIGFFRGDDTNGVFVQRSTNGGATWTRACIPIDTTPTNTTDDASVCGGTGDPRQPGDGVVTFNADTNPLAGSNAFDDKEYMASGPRPAGVQPVCFTPLTRAPTACNPAVVGVDRLYVTFSRFESVLFNTPRGPRFFTVSSKIMLSYSDDQGRSWSRPRLISGSSNVCTGSFAGGRACDDNQFSVPTVNVDGTLYVEFENFDTPDENQILVVRNRNGGNAPDEGPFFVTPVFDVNFPQVGITRPDCSARGAQFGRRVYTNSCFRTNAAGNITVDKRGGAFADDLYVVIADNRNGTPASSNSDVFLFKSTDGGTTWVGPTRVNNDRSVAPPDRDCSPTITTTTGTPPVTTTRPNPACQATDFGNDQWWPWVDIGKGGELNIAFKDRRLDTNSVAHEWPTSRQRPGNYLVWTFGAQCKVSKADSRECLAPAAAVIAQPTAPIDPGSGPVPGQGNQFLGTLRNFKVSDVPSNFDYSFRAGIFAGDYENIAVSNSDLLGGGSSGGGEDGKDGKGNCGNQEDSGSGNGQGNTCDDDGDDDGEEGKGGAFAVNVFTDARNGRSSRNQAGRNPICEQSDVFFDIYPALTHMGVGSAGNIEPFLVTPCPGQAVEAQDDDDKGKGKDDD